MTPASIVIGDTTGSFTLTVANSITRDTGSLVLAKSLTGGPAGYDGPFTIDYDCDDGSAHDGSVTVIAGRSETVSGIPTGTSCTVSETPPTAPTGYTFGTPTLSPSATVTIAANDATVEVTTNNALSRDTGSLRILKTVSNPDGAPVPASFSVNYNCGTGHAGTVSAAPGSPATVNGIPTGNTCTVTEVAPTTIPNHTWGTITYTPASVVISTKGDTFNITVGNSITRETGQGLTRTQGFWATHTPLANIAWFGGTAFGHTFPGVAATAGIGNRTLCGRSIDTLGKLMGGFWSNIAKKTTGAKRSALEQARMQLLQQLLAAELNASAFGTVPSGGAGVFAQWEAAYCGSNINAITNAQQAAAFFNTNGDSGQFTPGTPADSKNARAIADLAFWNTLP